MCPLGYENNGTGSYSVCIPCKKGYYKDTASPQSCVMCPYFVTTATTGSTSVSQCLGMTIYNSCLNMISYNSCLNMIINNSCLNMIIYY